MGLNPNVASQFAKLVNTEDKTLSETVNATYVKKIGDTEYVRIDGSDILTPVESAVEAEAGERVQVLIKNHAATITGNITSPAARKKSVDTLKDEVDEQGNTIKQMDNSIVQQGNSIIEINNAVNQQNNIINQHNTLINQQNDKIQSINNTIDMQNNAIEVMNNSISAFGNDIDMMNNTIDSQNNVITSIGNTVQSFNNRITQNSNDISQQGNTISQQGNNITEINNIINRQGNTITEINNVVNRQNSVIETMDSTLIAHGSNIQILNSGFIIIDDELRGLSSAIIDSLKTSTLDTGYAQIDFANIGTAAVEKIFSDSGIIDNLIVDQGHITGELVGVTIKGDLIEGNTIKAEKLIVRGTDGLYYKLNTNGNTIESEQTNENSINGSIITAKSVTATKINVEDLVAFGATIGGFEITDTSINTHLKTSAQSSVEGLYFGSDGQIGIGDANNHIQYYKDENNNFILDVRLDKLYLGASDKTLDKWVDGVVEVSAAGLSTTFKSSGGNNLLRNSVGFSGTSFWAYSGNISTNAQDDLSLSGSEFILTDQSSLQQTYNTVIGDEYSVSFKYKHKTTNTTPKNIVVKLVGQDNEIEILNTTNVSDEWVSVATQVPYKATAVSPHILITCESGDELHITDLMIVKGLNDVWSGYIDEVYGKQHQLDENGLRLYSKSSAFNSNVTSTEFQIKNNNTVISELSKERVYAQNGEYVNSYKLGKLKTVLLDSNNIIEYL